MMTWIGEFARKRPDEITRPCQQVMRSFQLLILSFAISTGLVCLAGCSSLPRAPYTASDAASARVLNVNELRRYTDEPAAMFLKEPPVSLRAGPVSYLALSRGGADGAYGAGVLQGWTT